MSDRLIKLWECPDCAFGFDAMHSDIDGTYSCPLCAETRLLAEVEKLRAEIQRRQDYDDQCDRDFTIKVLPGSGR